MKKSSIKIKFILGFLVIFFTSNMALNLYIRKSIEENRKISIRDEKSALFKSSREFIRNTLEGDMGEISEDALKKSAYGLVVKLSVLNNSYVSIRDCNGDLIEEINTDIPIEAINENSDVKEAIKNNAYYVLDNYGGRAVLRFSYPLYLNNKFLGVVCFREDYSNVNSRDIGLINNITIIQVITLIIAIIFSAVLINRLMNPLKTLTRKIEDMRNGIYDGEIRVKSKDEIGILANTFNIMKDEISQYILSLEVEQAKVMKLEKTRQEFFNNITHELKTPLTGISSYAQILEEGVDDEEFSKRAATRIKQESDRLHGLVLDLIEVSKGNTEIEEEEARIDISKLIEKVSNDLYKKAEGYGARIVLELEKIELVGREKKLQQLFINVIDNAIKYSVPNKEIRIKTFRYNGFINIEIENHSEKEYMENTEQLFLPFMKVDSREKGSRGLGLNISRKIVETHKGTIEIKWQNYKVQTLIKFSDVNILATS